MVTRRRLAWTTGNSQDLDTGLGVCRGCLLLGIYVRCKNPRTLHWSPLSPSSTSCVLRMSGILWGKFAAISLGLGSCSKSGFGWEGALPSHGLCTMVSAQQGGPVLASKGPSQLLCAWVGLHFSMHSVQSPHLIETASGTQGQCETARPLSWTPGQVSRSLCPITRGNEHSLPAREEEPRTRHQLTLPTPLPRLCLLRWFSTD